MLCDSSQDQQNPPSVARYCWILHVFSSAGMGQKGQEWSQGGWGEVRTLFASTRFFPCLDQISSFSGVDRADKMYVARKTSSYRGHHDQEAVDTKMLFSRSLCQVCGAVS